MAKDDKEKEDYTPTPPLGFPVYYYMDYRQPESKMTGWCVHRSDVGKINVLAVRPNGSLYVKIGVMHKSHPDMAVGGPQARNGAWELPDWLPPPRGLYDMAKEKEARKLAQLETAKKQQDAILRQEANMKKLSQEQEPQKV